MVDQPRGRRRGAADTLLTQGTLLYESQSFAYSLHTLVFAAGATMFYALLARSRVPPRPLVVLGLIAAPLALVGQVLVMFGVDVPLYVLSPNLPFELEAGLWLALRGRPEAERSLLDSRSPWWRACSLPRPPRPVPSPSWTSLKTSCSRPPTTVVVHPPRWGRRSPRESRGRSFRWISSHCFRGPGRGRCYR